MDCSLSMKALEGGATRFDAARAEARGIIRRLPEGSAVSIVLLSDGVREQAVDASPQKALEVLEKSVCSSRPLDVSFAAAYIKACTAPVIVVTDKELQLGRRMVRVGGELNNAGITRASYDYYGGGVFFTLKNYSGSAKRVVVELWSADRKIDAAAVELRAGAAGNSSFSAPGAGGVLVLKIEQQDMLEEDNIYFVPAGDEGRKKVLLYGKDYFLENALAAMADVRLLDGSSGTADSGDRPAVIVAQGGAAPAPALPEGAGVWYLVPGTGAAAGKRLPGAGLRASGSPLTEGLALKDVYLEEAVPLAGGENMRKVIQAGEAVVMAAGYDNGRRTVYSSIDFNRTNIVLLPEFPVLVSNIVNWLAGDGGADVPGNPPPFLASGGDSAGPAKDGPAGGPLYHRLGNFFILLALALLAAEWEVYRRGL
jgi:hypothetical protein